MLRRLFVYPFFLFRKNRVKLNAEVEPGCFLRDSSIGAYSYVGRNCVINSTIIGNYSCVAAHVHIGGMEHSIDELSISPAIVGEKCVLGQKTVIGNDVWIGAACVIKQGVSIGDGAIIGANSFVNKDVEPYAIVFGSPARFHRFRRAKEFEKEIRETLFWNKKPREAKAILQKIYHK